MSNFVISAPEGSKIPLIEPNMYPAVCIGIYDLGEQYNEKFGNTSRKCVFQFEIPGETVTIDGEEKARVISETYTASLGEKANLRKVLESWRGRPFTQEELRGFDLQNVLGAPCMLNVIHEENSKGNTFAKIASVTRLAKGMEVSSDTKKTMFYMEDPHAVEIIETFPEWLQKRMKESETYKRISLQSGFVEVEDSDLPF